jgi:hypothetical protein
LFIAADMIFIAPVGICPVLFLMEVFFPELGRYKITVDKEQLYRYLVQCYAAHTLETSLVLRLGSVNVLYKLVVSLHSVCVEYTFQKLTLFSFSNDYQFL